MPFLLEGGRASRVSGQERMLKALATISQAFLRTDPGLSLRPWGRRCLADHHLRTWCPPNKPPGASSGLGKPGSNPGGATDRDRARLTMLPCDAEAIPQRMRTRSGSTIQRWPGSCSRSATRSISATSAEILAMLCVGVRSTTIPCNSVGEYSPRSAKPRSRVTRVRRSC